MFKSNTEVNHSLNDCFYHCEGMYPWPYRTEDCQPIRLSQGCFLALMLLHPKPLFTSTAQESLILPNDLRLCVFLPLQVSLSYPGLQQMDLLPQSHYWFAQSTYSSMDAKYFHFPFLTTIF